MSFLLFQDKKEDKKDKKKEEKDKASEFSYIIIYLITELDHFSNLM